MKTIAHRDLRNDSSRILSRVQAGETFTITNHGEVVAVLAPPPAHMSELERLRAAGKTRPGRMRRRRIAEIPRASDVRSEELLDDVRGAW